MKDELLEQLADAEHASWARWMRYLFSQCTYAGDGTMVIPAWAVELWQRQATTPYADLTEREKQMDRDEVQRILPFIDAYASAAALAAERPT